MKKIGIYTRSRRVAADGRFLELCRELESDGFETYRVVSTADLQEGTDCLLSVGGDGTFLACAALLGNRQIPVLGVNMGRLGFLSENRPEEVCKALKAGRYTVEDRALLWASPSLATGCEQIDACPYALNEVTVHRSGAAMLGVDVKIDGVALPTYWADGLLVATSSGSTAYSLSVGGPIALPQSDVLIVAPIASHNLNVRPLIVPSSAKIDIALRSRDSKVLFTMDNRTAEVSAQMTLSVCRAPFPLRRMSLGGANFIDALVSKLFWGEDIRNQIR